MARTNVFELLASKWDLGNDVDRILVLFQDRKIIQKNDFFYTINGYVSNILFNSWNSRGHMLDLSDFLKEVEFEQLYFKAKAGDINSFFCIAEIVYTFWNLIQTKVQINSQVRRFASDFKLLQTIILDCLSHYNYTIYYNEEKEQAIVVEDKPEVTAVAEILNPEISFPIIKYNHYTMKGDIQTKGEILTQMGNELEPKRKILKEINKSLEDYLFYLLNVLNLRHNNCAEGSDNYKKYVAQMNDQELEKWYDELYEMILLAFLEIDQKDRNQRCKELRAIIEAK